jgi:hypothetical protein
VWVRPTARRGPYGDAQTGWRDRRVSACGDGSRACGCGAGCSAGTCACSWDSPDALCRRTPSGARERPLTSATRLLYAAAQAGSKPCPDGPNATACPGRHVVPMTSRWTPLRASFCAATSTNVRRTPGDTPTAPRITWDEVARRATRPLGFSTISLQKDPRRGQDRPQAE